MVGQDPFYTTLTKAVRTLFANCTPNQIALPLLLKINFKNIAQSDKIRNQMCSGVHLQSNHLEVKIPNDVGLIPRQDGNFYRLSKWAVVVKLMISVAHKGEINTL